MRGPECPVLLRHVWAWFSQLSNMREWGDGSPRAIRASEIAAWSQLTGNRPTPREINIILDLDIRFRNITAETDEGDTAQTDAERQMLAWVSAAKAAKSWG
jgi:hypothetical protein